MIWDKKQKVLKTNISCRGLLCVIIIGVFLIFPNSAILAEEILPATETPLTYNMRILFHGQKKLLESDFGIAGWLSFPNITNNPNRAYTVFGPGYYDKGWTLETMLGGIIDKSTVAPLLDVRFSMNPNLLFGLPVLIYGDMEWIGPFSGQDTFYTYLQADCIMPGNFILLGLETENVFKSTGNILSFGPQVLFPLGNNMNIIVAYQFGTNQVWIRNVFNF